MNGKKLMSIVGLFAVASIIVSSSAIANPTLAQTTKSKGGTASSSASKDYKDFQKCLSNAEVTKGYATKQEIKACFNPIYNPAGTGTTSSTGTTSRTGTTSSTGASTSSSGTTSGTLR